MSISLNATLIEPEGHKRPRAAGPEGAYDPRAQLTGRFTK